MQSGVPRDVIYKTHGPRLLVRKVVKSRVAAPTFCSVVSCCFRPSLEGLQNGPDTAVNADGNTETATATAATEVRDDNLSCATSPELCASPATPFLGLNPGPSCPSETQSVMSTIPDSKLSMFCILYYNARSLFPKLDQLRLNV